ncbi:M48 family metallopeptidase [Candidatus Marsarchaeota archaeon]|nr:M48 family metallopeptidase [Candidatus Marsarchaeota archaeon]MCL5099626.1 M48 family metallopeptidase [Candidatus Marsarchaeota archaeon]
MVKLEFDAVMAGSMAIGVRVEKARLKNAHASVRDGVIVIRLPRWMGKRAASAAADNLYKRMRRAIEKNPGRFLADKTLGFGDGQVTEVGGRRLSIRLINGRKRYAARLSGDSVLVYAPDGYDARIVSRLASKVVARAAKPYVEERIVRINAAHFGSVLSGVVVRDNSVIWGSCSPNNRISINLKLLYAPESVLDYVIAHELAHTRVRNHSKRFWDEVARAAPNYRDARKWLKDSSHLIKP